MYLSNVIVCIFIKCCRMCIFIRYYHIYYINSELTPLKFTKENKTVKQDPNNIIKYYQILSNIIKYNQILSNIITCYQILSNVIKYYQMLYRMITDVWIEYYSTC